MLRKHDKDIDYILTLELNFKEGVRPPRWQWRVAHLAHSFFFLKGYIICAGFVISLRLGLPVRSGGRENFVVNVFQAMK